MAKTNRPLEMNLWGVTTTIPEGTPVILVKGADGLMGDLWAVQSKKLLVELTGNTHDPKYRYAFVPSDAVSK